ncbi:MAG TPA: GNAT family N-acetyltransferase [Burkholderiaceae bacterium]|nr:GNAT family N-acetyltransferase [Burkholderiaceae bacterium]
MSALDEQVWTAHGDAWQAEGRLRARFGGGARELAGVRLSSSGLPHPQWNNGDLTDLTHFDLAQVRDWFAARAGGAGVPWGIRVQAGTRFPHGRFRFTRRCMALLPARFAPARVPAGVELVVPTVDDIERAASIDAAAFDEAVEHARPWIAPHFDAAGFAVALARLNGEAVATATAVHTDDRAGRCVCIFGVGVLAHARGRGIGAAITSWLLEHAFDDGATLAHLNPNTEAAARIYARLGFVETAGFDIYVDL